MTAMFTCNHKVFKNNDTHHLQPTTEASSLSCSSHQLQLHETTASHRTCSDPCQLQLSVLYPWMMVQAGHSHLHLYPEVFFPLQHTHLMQLPSGESDQSVIKIVKFINKNYDQSMGLCLGHTSTSANPNTNQPGLMNN